ncbi:retrovirus-related Pol polyprotein from transposon gypsy [Trichonephila clavipes]|nr:retrovirus-related Pol polyprotein from transposon gypsy [Trichonephila clavipes]
MSALDLRSGYFQMAVNPSDIVKTVFVTKNGTYAFHRMPFGLSGAAPNFQKAIDIILKFVIGKFVSVYMDDVIISSPSLTQHVKHLKEVFRLLHEAGLTLNKDKCKFGCEELKYLGLIINKEGIKTDETKVQAIVEMKRPHNSKEVSNAIYIWSIEAQKAFDAVKVAITKAPVLKFPDFKKPFELFTDASSIGVGAVLNQEQRPVVFASRTLREELHVITDHAALTHLTTGKNLSNRMIRWALKLAEFNIEWEHRPGTQNTIADVLSRNPIESIIGEKVNCAIIRDLVLSSRDQLIEQKTDPELGHIYRYLENPEDSSVNAAILKERLGIRHVKTVVYRPQANRTERVNRDLVQMIANYVNEQHDTWDQFLREFAYAIRTAINETTGKTPAELFLGRTLITPFQKLVMVSDRTEFAVEDIERLFEEARRNTETKHDKWKKYYNRRRRDVQIKVNDWVLVATHPLSSATRKVVAKFKTKFEGPYRVLDVKNNNLYIVIWKAGKRSRESRSGGPERKVQKGSEHRVNKRALSSNYRTNHSLTKFRKKSRREETVTPTTSGYNLRPRIGKREEPRPTIERKTQHGGPVRSRKGRERNDSPYIEERTRSNNKNARRGGDQQRQDQERRGTCTKKSLSREVLVGNANYKS